MEAILTWGLDFIRAVQIIASPALTVFMRIISSIGGEPLYLVLLPVLYWCIDERKGLRLGMVVLISTWINLLLKYYFDQPRPFFEGYDPSVGMVMEYTGGLPSGHAQNTLVMLFIAASWFKKKRAYVCAVFLCLLIGFSRIYLGVHFPTDILAGWILGGIILLGYFLFNKKIEELIDKGGLRAGMIMSAAVSFVMILHLPAMELLMPAGTILGLGVGYCLNRRHAGFSSNALFGRTGIKKYLTFSARMFLGIAGFFLIFFAAGSMIPQQSDNYKLYGFLQAALGGFWLSVAAPWVFIKLGLAEAQPLFKPEEK